jgi:transposase InsO family protein
MICVRKREDEKLQQRIRTIHDRSRQIYGAPRIHAELQEEGTRVGRKRVARLMNESGLAGVSRRKWTVTTRRDRSARPAPDLVDRHFVTDKPNALWVADITYVPTWVGFLYLAVVMDVWSRKIVGWAMASHLRTCSTRRHTLQNRGDILYTLESVTDVCEVKERCRGVRVAWTNGRG